MTNPKEQGRTYIDPETNKFVTEDTSGRKREATVDEIERTGEVPTPIASNTV